MESLFGSDLRRWMAWPGGQPAE